MSEYKFGVGEYKTKCGSPAKVKFVMPEPRNSLYPLIGWVKRDGGFVSEHWNSRGEPAYCFDNNLVPPVQYMWRAVQAYASTGWYSKLATTIAVTGDDKILGVLRATGWPGRLDFDQPVICMTLEQAKELDSRV